MSDESESDKPFEPTEQKLRRAREKGDFPRTAELNAAVAYLGLLLALGLGSAVAVPAWLSATSAAVAAGGGLDSAALIWVPAALGLLGVLTLVVLLLAVGLIAQRNLVVVPSKIAPDLKRINPVGNARQKFGRAGWLAFGVSVGKSALVAAGGVVLFRVLMARFSMPAEDAGWVGAVAPVLRQVALLGLTISAVFGAVDLGWRIFEHRRRNRMSLQEMRDEMKDAEGDPHMKQARRQRGYDIVMNAMLADVEKADVVVVNPTHYAVALQWKRGSGRAPVCVAKGVDEVARRIRERAGRHGVPIWPDPPCARALHASTDIGSEIEPEHFAAVAAAIRFSERMRQKVRLGW